MPRRRYYLEGREIRSSDCYGFVHTSRKEYKCVACGKSIKKGVKYVRFNYPFMANEVLHLDCAVANWSQDDNRGYVVLATKTESRRMRGLRRDVVCKKFYPDDQILAKETDDDVE